jgi:hypothetical protein
MRIDQVSVVTDALPKLPSEDLGWVKQPSSVQVARGTGKILKKVPERDLTHG